VEDAYAFCELLLLLLPGSVRLGLVLLLLLLPCRCCSEWPLQWPLTRPAADVFLLRLQQPFLLL